MSSAADPFSILNRNGQAPGFKKPEPRNRVNRHRAGKAVQFEEEEDEDNDDIFTISHFNPDSDQVSVTESNITSKKEEEELNARLRKRRQIQRSVIVEENKNEHEDSSRIEAVDQGKESIKPEKMVEENEDVEAEQVVRRRAQMKERLLEQEKVNEDDIHLMKIDENDEMDEENEEENEEEGGITMLKPIFVSKHERETMTKQLEEEIALREEESRLKEKRKADTKLMFLEAVRQDNEIEKQEDNLSDGQMPADDDDVDEANQYEQWKIRELKRIKRDREERSKQDKEKAEIERRRQLTDAQRAFENKVLGSDSTEKVERVQYKFMQKYYHKGGFFQDSDDPIFKRDTNFAVGEDNFDKSGLPNSMRVRRDQFGKRGQTKYTHLTDQDTTNFDPQYRVNEAIQSKTQSRLGGYKGQDTLDRPSARKR